MSGRKDEVTGKIPESAFKYCAFIEKPFDQKQLITGIKEAMEKAKLIPKPPESSLPKEEDSQGTQAMSAEIQQLKAKMAKMQSEITALKKQLGQLVKVVQQKMR